MAVPFFLSFARAYWLLLRWRAAPRFLLDGAPGPLRLCLRLLGFFAPPKRGVGKKPYGVRLAAALEAIGPAYVKLGQFLATRPDIIGENVANDLSRLQYDLTPIPAEEALRLIERALGKDPAQIFADISPPVAAASIAQVHRATLRTPYEGITDVAIKIVRPDVRKKIHADFRAFRRAAAWMERARSLRRFRLNEAASGLEAMLRYELDLRFEAASGARLDEALLKSGAVRTARIVWPYIRTDLLVSAWAPGKRASEAILDPELCPAARKKAAGNILRMFLRCALYDGFFHADMHQGNVLIDSDGNVVLVDYGIMGTLSGDSRASLALILKSFMDGDYEKAAELHKQAGYIDASVDVTMFALALRSLGEPILGHKARNINSARLLWQLLEVTGRFGMRARLELLALQRTMVALEGLVKNLDPDIDYRQIAAPIVSAYVKRTLGAAAMRKRAIETSRALVHSLEDVPQLLAGVKKLFEPERKDGLLRAKESATLKVRIRRMECAIYILGTALALVVAWAVFA